MKERFEWGRTSPSNEKQFRGGLVFKAHGCLYHSTLGSRVIKKKKNLAIERAVASLDAVRAVAHEPILAGAEERPGVAFRVYGLRVEVQASGCRFEGLKCRVSGLGLMGWGSGFGGSGSGFQV